MIETVQSKVCRLVEKEEEDEKCTIAKENAYFVCDNQCVMNENFCVFSSAMRCRKYMSSKC